MSPAAPTSVKRSWLARLLQQRSIQIALFVWLAASLAIFPLAGLKNPLNRPDFARQSLAAQVITPLVGLIITLIQIAITYLLTRRRVIPDMAARAPAAAI